MRYLAFLIVFFWKPNIGVPTSHSVAELDLAKERIDMVQNYVQIRDEVTVFIGMEDAGASKLLKVYTNQHSGSKADNKFLTYLFNKYNKDSYKLFLPEYFTNANGDFYFYGCPPFKIRRNVSVDLPAAYFVKHLLSSSKRKKIILVINYQTLEKYYNFEWDPYNQQIFEGNHFVSFFYYLYRLFPSFTNYLDALGLIVTDANNSLTISDNKDNIVDWLKYLKTDMEFDYNQTFDSKLKAFYENTMNLISVIMTRDQSIKGWYTKIAILRSENEVDNIQEPNLDKINSFLNNDTKYADAGKNSFRYPLLHNTLRALQLTTDYLILNIDRIVKKVFSNIIDYSRKIARSGDNFNLLVVLKELNKGIADLTAVNTRTIDINTFLFSLLNAFAQFDLNNKQSTLITLNKYYSNLKFVKFFGQQISMSLPDEWTRSVIDSINVLTSWKAWVEFLLEMKVVLSRYDVQHAVEKYNVKNIDDWGQYGKRNGIKITTENLATFLNKLQLLTGKRYFEVKQLKPSGSKLILLNELLSKILDTPVNVSCHDNKLTLSGYNVKFSQLVVETQKCLDATIVELFATNTVFFDTDYERAGFDLILCIVSPVWEVVGHSRIAVNGSQHNYPPNPNKTGEDGRAGYPGTGGGNILGFGNEYNHINNLKLVANGGDGGLGETGAAGVDGIEGAKPDVPELYDGLLKCFMSCLFVGQHLTRVRLFESLIYLTLRGYVEVPFEPKSTDGGNGGIGGLEGYPGIIRIYNLNGENISDLNIAMERENGSIGPGGKGGQPGKRDKYPQNRYFSCDGANYLVYTTSDVQDNGCRYRHRFRHIVQKSEGKAGVSTKELQQPDMPSECELVPFIIHYRFVLFQHLVNNPLFFDDFLALLYQTNSILQYYSTNEYLLEFKNMEEVLHYDNIKSAKVIIVFYEQFLERLEVYMKNVESLLDIKILNFLITSTVTKLSNLRDAKETFLIVDIKGYLALIANSIERYDFLKQIVQINDINTAYKKPLDAKIRQAETYINDGVIKDISASITKIQKEFEKLIDVLTKLQEEERKRLEELKEKRKQVLQNLILGTIFDCMTILGSFVSLIPKVGWVVGPALIAAGEGGKALSGCDEEVEIPKASNAVQESVSVVNNVFNKEQNENEAFEGSLSHLLNDYEALISKNYLANITGQYSKEKDSVKSMFNGVKGLAQNVSEANRELTNAIKRHLKNIDKFLQKLEKYKAAAMKAINKISDYTSKYGNVFKEITDSVQITSGQLSAINAGLAGSASMSNRLATSVAKLDEIENEEQQAKQNIEVMEHLKNSVKEEVIPQMDNLRDSLTIAAKQMTSENSVELDIRKFEIGKVLGRVKKMLNQYLGEIDPSIKDNVNTLLKKLEDSMNIANELSQRIEQIRNDKNMLDYTAKTQTAGSDHSDIEDEAIRKDIELLELKIQSNILQWQYGKFYKQFKQWAFPHGKKYLEIFTAPTNLKTSSEIVNTYKKQLGTLQAKLHEYSTVIVGNHDRYIKTEKFDTTYRNGEFFYIWKNRDHISEIDLLLSGEEVYLLADVKKSNPSKIAIKFKEVKINFKVGNASEFSNIMEQFVIQLTHTGNNYFQCDNAYYLLITDSQTIEYSFQTDENKEPIISNNVYEKIKNGDLMLSPYATWAVRLIPRNMYVSFDNLKKFARDVDIELIGTGIYSTNIDLCSEVDEFYKEYKLQDPSTSLKSGINDRWVN